MSATSKTSTRHFYPRSPCGERRKFGFTHTAQELFLSTLSLRRATFWFSLFSCPALISIHALLAESDPMELLNMSTRQRFLSTLSLRRATSGKLNSSGILIFLSTLSLRRATVKDATARSNAQFLSTLSLRRATGLVLCQSQRRPISIHALLAESDAYGRINDISRLIFLSTLSLRRATTTTITICTVSKFLSTLSLRRATYDDLCFDLTDDISIHALLAESDGNNIVRPPMC